MSNTQAMDVPKAVSYFMASEGGSYFCYDHLEGVLITAISDGCRRGIFTRVDSTAAMLARQHHREMANGVPSHERLYEPLTELEFHEKFNRVLNTIHENYKIVTL
jgi:hypothetical protein